VSADLGYTADEMMAVAAARRLHDGTVCFVGIGLPSQAANLARRTHAPGCVLIYESGTIGAKPTRLPLSIGDGELAATADTVVSVPEIFAYWLQGGRIDVGFLGAAQIDRYGNLNSTVIGDYDRPKVRLPGAGGAPEIAASCRETFVMLRQSPRTFVEQLDFRSSVGYGDGPEVLHGIDLDVPAGTTVALVGHTGAGKSTIAKLLARFYDPRSGRITIDGVDLREVTQESLRRQLGIVPQEGFLFAGTVRENIAFARPDAPLEDVAAAAQAVGAHDFVVELEHGYDTELGERGYRLSLGQRQLVAFARALLADPRILILDEATSSVDTETEREIQAALENLTKGRTTIAIAHRLSTLRRADRIIVIERGQIVETGTHPELLRAKGSYARLHRAQVEAIQGHAV